MLFLVPGEGAEGAPLGYAFLRVATSGPAWNLGDRVGDLESLAVTAAARGLGIGTELIAHCRERLREIGAQSWSVCVVSRQRGAVDRYEREGFRQFWHTMIAPIGDAADLKEFAAVTATLNPELTDLSLERLRLRRSAKWRYYDEDVLPAWVAEMDFPLAPPVKIALAEAVELDDTGYAYPARARAGRGVRRLRPGALRMGGRPGRRLAAPDVVNGITSLLRKIAEPGDGVIINTPVYHPFFAIIEELGWSSPKRRWSRGSSTSTGSTPSSPPAPSR